MMWIWFAAACAVAIGLAYLATTWDSGVAPNLLTTLWQLLPTMMLYPFSHRLIERFEDADPRFR
jgi:rod shape-determining protein MreD